MSLAAVHEVVSALNQTTPVVVKHSHKASPAPLQYSDYARHFHHMLILLRNFSTQYVFTTLRLHQQPGEEFAPLYGQSTAPSQDYTAWLCH